MHTTCHQMSCTPRITIHRADVKTTRRSHLGPVEALCDNKFCRVRSEKHLKTEYHTQHKLQVTLLVAGARSSRKKTSPNHSDTKSFRVSNEAFECSSPIQRIIGQTQKLTEDWSLEGFKFSHLVAFFVTREVLMKYVALKSHQHASKSKHASLTLHLN